MTELLILAAVLMMGALSSGGPLFSFSGGSAMGNAAAIIATGRTMLGWLYSLGAGLAGEKPSPPYTDCGKFIMDAHAPHGITMPRNITGQVNAAPWKMNVQGWTRDALLQALRPGDCIAFDWAGGFEGRPYDHGALWTGSKMIHASSSKGGVVEVNLIGSGWKTLYSWCRG